MIREDTNMDKNAKSVKSVFIAIFDCILLLAVIFVSYVMISGIRGKVVNVFGKSIMLVVTGSMEPSINAGDYILIEKISSDELNNGDIITFYSSDKSIEGMLNTHRIVGRLDTGDFITKGDANLTADSASVNPDQIIGRYVKKLRFFRWVNSFKSLKKIAMLLIFVVSALMAFSEVKNIGKIVKSSSEEKEQEYEDKIREAIEKEKQKLYEEQNNRGDDNS